MRELPCGCRTCGCLCPDHSPDGRDRPCFEHVRQTVAAAIGEEAARLIGVALLAGLIISWCAILSV